MAIRHQYSVWHIEQETPLFETRVKTEAISFARKNYGRQEREECIDITCYRLNVPFHEAGAHILDWDKTDAGHPPTE